MRPENQSFSVLRDQSVGRSASTEHLSKISSRIKARFSMQKSDQYTGCRMNLYHIQFEDFEGIAIFAASMEDVESLADLYLAFHSAENTNYQISHPVGFSHLTTLEVEQLQDAFSLNAQGCGIYDSEMGWRIVQFWQMPLSPLWDNARSTVKSAA